MTIGLWSIEIDTCICSINLCSYSWINVCHSKEIVCMNCETCGTNEGLTRSHLVKKNSVHKTKLKDYDYESPDNYFIQCLNCHIGYERLSKVQRMSYMVRRRMTKYSARIRYLINE